MNVISPSNNFDLNLSKDKDEAEFDKMNSGGAQSSEPQKNTDFRSAALKLRNVARMRRIVDNIRTAKKEGSNKHTQKTNESIELHSRNSIQCKY